MLKNNLQLENFGPIKEASIEILPLTIFTGTNNSGKSLTSLLIHLFLKNNTETSSNNISFGLISFNWLYKNNKHVYYEFNELFKKYLLNKPSLNSKPLVISTEFFNKLLLEGIGKYYTFLLENNIKTFFGLDLDKLINFNSKHFNIAFNNFKFQYNDNLRILNFQIKENISYTINKKVLFKITEDKDKILINLNYALFTKITDNKSQTELFYIFLAENIFDTLNNRNSFYITSSRGELIKNPSIYIEEFNNISKFSKTQKDLAKFLLNLNNNLKKKYYYKIAKKLEEEILNGEIVIYKNKIGTFDIKFKDKNTEEILNLNQLSSSTRELIPLILYLKYQLEKGDTLIIEEPEAQVHPKNQRILVKYFVNLVNEGLNIILNTHSDFIIEQFNNYIRLGNSNKKPFIKYNYTKKNILNYKDINIYNFEEINSSSFKVSRLDINHTGFNEESLTEVIEELYDESDYIIDSKIK